MLNHFTFNGHSTGELGLLVSGINIYGSPSRIVEKVTIPYRSGDLIIDTGAYTNYMLTYTVDIMDNTKATAEAISKWLLGSKGYCELTDTYNPEIYRVASYYNQLDYTLSALYRYGKATITFDCKPQKYLTANQPVSLSSTLSEATSYSLSTPAMPLPITLEGNTTQGADPTPDAPQEIHSVKGDNEVRVVGFNLFDKNAMVKDCYITDGGGEQISSTGSNSTPFIQVIPNQQYYIKSEATASRWGAWYDISKNYISGIRGANAIYTAPTNAYFMRMTINSPSTGNPDTFCINVSDTEKNGTYEPYKAQVYPINLPVENLTNATDIIAPPNVNSSNTRIGGDYSLTAGTYTLSWTISNTVTGTRNRPLYTVVGGSSVYCPTDSYTKGRHSWTFTLDTDANVVMYWWYYTLSAECTISEFMLEKGTSTTYFPYGTTSIELNALGTYKDYFHKTNGKWYLHKETGTADIGSLTWSKGSTSYYMNDLASVFKIPLQTETPEIKSSIGMIPKSANAVSGVAGSNETYINSSGLLIYYFSMTKYASATEFMNAMKGQTMIYQAKPTETEITDATLISQLNALSKAKTYEGSTTIVQEGTDAQFKLAMPVPTEITSQYFGEPVITVNEVGTIVWNDSLIKVNSAPVTINSQTLQCYYYSENKNNDVEINEFPKYENENYIGSTMALTVVPNYWKL